MSAKKCNDLWARTEKKYARQYSASKTARAALEQFPRKFLQTAFVQPQSH
jgi:hypothetical protein